MRTATQLWHRITTRGEFFGARGCSGGCTCDPCECDPCTCGTDERHPNPPRWRVSGYQVQKGKLQGTDITGLVLFSLSLPFGDGPDTPWREIMLVDSCASDEQLTCLLAEFEPELVSMPAAYRAPDRPLPPVFRVPISYTSEPDAPPVLSVDCAPETLVLVRAGALVSEPFVWRYEGPMALQRPF